MKNNQLKRHKSPLEKVYPNLTPEQLEEAEYYLLRYIRTVRRIFERIKREHPEILTELENRARLRKQRRKQKSL